MDPRGIAADTKGVVQGLWSVEPVVDGTVVVFVLVVITLLPGVEVVVAIVVDTPVMALIACAVECCTTVVVWSGTNCNWGFWAVLAVGGWPVPCF